MRILLDECVPRKLKPHLANHICRTASEAGFSGKKNGVLLRLAEAEAYDVNDRPQHGDSAKSGRPQNFSVDFEREIRPA